MRNLEPRRARWIAVRMGVLCLLLTSGLGSVVVSAFNIQVKHGAEWRTIAERQRQRRLKVQPMRGSILDRNGEPIAVSVDVPSVAINVPEMLRNQTGQRAEALLSYNATRLAQALGLPATEVQQRLATRRRFVWLKRRLGQEEVTALRALTDPRRPDAINGVMLEGEGHRFYPGREALWGLVGFVGSDGTGLDGLERGLDQELRGRPDQVTALRDRKGTLLFGDGLEDERALAGDDVHLALDLGLQFQVQEELEAGLRAFEAKAASAVVIDPNSGEILALATAPAYNPNDYGDTPVEMRRHHAIADRVEPGSTIKIFTIAAAIAEGKLKPNDSLFCENGAWSIGGITIHDTHPEGNLTPTQVIARSSNICAAKIGLSLGESGLYTAFKRFGFGEVTGVDLPGEASGVLRAKGRPWYEVEVASASFGQGISVTTLQMGLAMGAIANGGRLLAPLLVRKVTSANGSLVRENLPTVKREAVPASVARTLAEMMTSVVEEGGTGKEANIPGYRVAGKTATAQKADPATGKYDPDKFVSSFVGFLPAQRPRFVIAVVLDEPWVAHLGGQVAAPIFRRIAQHALARFGVAPSGDVARAPLNFPVEDPTPRVYASLAPAASSALDFTGPAGAVVAPMPSVHASADRPMPVASTSPAVVASAANTASTASSANTESVIVVVPNVSGLPARDAVRAAVASGLSPVLEGSGLVARQEPAPGLTLPKGATLKLRLEPPI